ncbi:MAG: ribonuclease HIII [Ktedonobacteraceae bacterium]|nr:ribonuclease HIII [Ktedonobacteraceae bacterium]
MGENKLEARLAALRAFIDENGWSVVNEKAIAHGQQVEVTDGISRIPVNIFATGKILVQGKPGTLQSILKTWSGQQLSQEEAAQQGLRAETVPPIRGIARIGSDESGKGDYFGPLVVGAVFVDAQSEQRLLNLGVRDSKLLRDKAIANLAQEIKQCCRGWLVTYRPERYNRLYSEIGNLNRLLAQAHAHAITMLCKRVECQLAVVDQFADRELVEREMERQGCMLKVEQRPRAEDDIAVAAASIVARAEFVKQLTGLEQEFGFTLPKGASNPEIVSTGQAIVSKYGVEALSRLAKLHFKTSESILQQVL